MAHIPASRVYRDSLLEQLSAGSPGLQAVPLPSHDAPVRGPRSFRLRGPLVETPRSPVRGCPSSPRSPAAPEGRVNVEDCMLLDTHGPCAHGGGHGSCPHHHSMVIDFIDNCIANGVPEELIERQVRFMIHTMEEVVSMHAALHERFHKDRLREYEIQELTNALERKERLSMQDRQWQAAPPAQLVSEGRAWGGDATTRAGATGLHALGDRSPSPTRSPRAWATRNRLSPRRFSAEQRSPSEASTSRRMSLRYGRAVYHVLSPHRHDDLGKVDDVRGSHAPPNLHERHARGRRASSPPPLPRERRHKTRVCERSLSSDADNGDTRHRPAPVHNGRSGGYLLPTHASARRHSHPRPTSHDSEESGPRTAGARGDAAREQSRAQLARARASVTRPTRASLLRAEATQQRQQRHREGLLTSAGSMTVAGVDEGAGDVREGQWATRLVSQTSGHPAADGPLRPPPRMSIERGSGTTMNRDDSRDGETGVDGVGNGTSSFAKAHPHTLADSTWTSRTGKEGGSRRDSGEASVTGDSTGVAPRRPAPERSGGTSTGLRQDLEEMIAESAASSPAAGRPWIVREAAPPPLTSPELQLFIEASQRRIRDAERLVARTTSNTSSIGDVSSVVRTRCMADVSAANTTAGTDSAVFMVHRSPQRRAQSQASGVDGRSPMVEISPTSSDED